MESSKWIKLPNGKLVKHRPDKLELLLAQSEVFISTETQHLRYNQDTPASSTSQSHSQYNTEAFDIRKLAGYEITILGAGSVGGYVIYCLGPARLLMNILDCKKVEFRHTQGGRTIYDHASIGLRKTDAVKQKLEHDYPGTKVHPYPYNVSEIPDIELQLMFARSLFTIIAIDDPVQMLRISDLAYPIVELIQVAMHTGAKSGHIAISVPFVTPCLRCTLDIGNSGDIHQLHSESANSWDIMTVAQQAARIAIDIIYSKVTGQEITRWDTSKNLIYIANTKQKSLSPDGPGMKFEGSLRRTGCPVCNLNNIPPERRISK